MLMRGVMELERIVCAEFSGVGPLLCWELLRAFCECPLVLIQVEDCCFEAALGYR